MSLRRYHRPRKRPQLANHCPHPNRFQSVKILSTSPHVNIRYLEFCCTTLEHHLPLHLWTSTLTDKKPRVIRSAKEHQVHVSIIPNYPLQPELRRGRLNKTFQLPSFKSRVPSSACPYYCKLNHYTNENTRMFPCHYTAPCVTHPYHIMCTDDWMQLASH